MLKQYLISFCLLTTIFTSCGESSDLGSQSIFAPADAGLPPNFDENPDNSSACNIIQSCELIALSCLDSASDSNCLEASNSTLCCLEAQSLFECIANDCSGISCIDQQRAYRQCLQNTEEDD